jgi:hypothetical protein
MFFKLVRYAYMYRMYDVFLFCMHVVADVDDYFVLCFFSVTSRGGLLSVHYYVVFDKYSFCCFFFLFILFYLFFINGR